MAPATGWGSWGHFVPCCLLLLEFEMEGNVFCQRREQVVYKVSAIAASVGVTGLAILATYLRFAWHVSSAGEMPWLELLATLALVGGGVVSSAHRVLVKSGSLSLEFLPSTHLCLPQRTAVLTPASGERRSLPAERANGAPTGQDVRFVDRF